MRRSRSWIAAAILIVLAGSGEARSAPRGLASASRHTENAAPAKPARSPTVYLFRGIFDVYSLGMDDLAGKLRARGIAASVYSHTDWPGLTDGIVARHRAGLGGPIVLIGHSLGGGAAIALAQSLGQAGITVDLVVPVDPVMAPPVPANVRHVRNYYQSNNGYGEPVGAAAGFRGALMNADLESNRRDLRQEGLTHTTIDKSARVHAEIIRAVLALGRR